MVTAWFKFIITSVRMIDWAGLDQPVISTNQAGVTSARPLLSCIYAAIVLELACDCTISCQAAAAVASKQNSVYLDCKSNPSRAWTGQKSQA